MQYSPRSIRTIVTGERVQVAPGFFVRRALPVDTIDMIDPWLMLDHMGPLDVAPGRAGGVPEHPHRGFEPITYLISGAVEHRDSAGNHVVVRSGDVNWMTAGSGITHSELPPEDLLRDGGRLHGFQIWLNLPREHQLTTPRIQHFTASQIPTVMLGDVRVKVIAGELLGTTAAIYTHSPVIYLHLTIPAGNEATVPVPENFNMFAFAAEGRGWTGMDKMELKDGQLALYGATGDSVMLGAGADSALDVLLIGGAPLNQPVFSYGPFVMSTRQEIVQAMEEYQAGKFGVIND
jgi:redox-sensitive bicupin YhaK (pirin superfamily)